MDVVLKESEVRSAEDPEAEVGEVPRDEVLEEPLAEQPNPPSVAAALELETTERIESSDEEKFTSDEDTTEAKETAESEKKPEKAVAKDSDKKDDESQELDDSIFRGHLNDAGGNTDDEIEKAFANSNSNSDDEIDKELAAEEHELDKPLSDYSDIENEIENALKEKPSCSKKADGKAKISSKPMTRKQALRCATPLSELLSNVDTESVGAPKENSRGGPGGRRASVTGESWTEENARSSDSSAGASTSGKKATKRAASEGMDSLLEHLELKIKKPKTSADDESDDKEE
ncbi:uncharacterized protein [Drosophila bipectinata]|uniref:uncharacterized protein n=1 Tax=Drosophila bipectinata TaxID=42026 RepID=UPI001C8A6987|nr:protein starmaker-like [Drosophila bipectinata]XP_043065687.1 protein starmaker-like [Drosophila bipectinata]